MIGRSTYLVTNSRWIVYVKSAYHLEKSLISTEGETSIKDAEATPWKAIWKIKVPASVKNFVWKACYDIIPTK